MRKADPELHSRRREEILAAAQLCFIERGFHQASMQNLAAAAGVSMGLLYRYFANKDAIIAAVAERDCDATVAHISDIAEAGDPTDIWTEQIEWMVAEGRKPDELRLVNEIVAEAGRNAGLKAMLRAYDRAVCDALAAKIVAQGLPIDAKIAAHQLAMIVDGLIARHDVAPAAALTIEVAPLVDAILGASG